MEDSVLVLWTFNELASEYLQRYNLRCLGACSVGIRLGLPVLGDPAIAAYCPEVVHYHIAHSGL